MTFNATTPDFQAEISTAKKHERNGCVGLGGMLLSGVPFLAISTQTSPLVLATLATGFMVSSGLVLYSDRKLRETSLAARTFLDQKKIKEGDVPVVSYAEQYRRNKPSKF